MSDLNVVSNFPEERDEKNVRNEVVLKIRDDFSDRFNISENFKGSKIQGLHQNQLMEILENTHHTGSTEKILQLFKDGMNIDQVDFEGRTALQMSAFRGKLDLVQELLLLGADVNKIFMFCDRMPKTALDAAKENKKDEIVQLLLTNGAKFGVEIQRELDAIDATKILRKVNIYDKEALQKIIKDILVPLYGEQSKTLHEWLTGDGLKHVYVITENQKIAGVLSLKAHLHKPYLKIATLVVLDEFKGKGYAKTLLAQAENFARENRYPSMIVTVSETITDALAFFESSGFTFIGKELGKYKENISEIILQKEIPWYDNTEDSNTYMKEITMDVQEPYFTLLIEGVKTVEGRLHKGKFAEVQVGGFITERKSQVKFEVVGKKIYGTFRELIDGEGIENVVPDKVTTDEAVDQYYKHYSKEDEIKFGVVAIQVQRVL